MVPPPTGGSGGGGEEEAGPSNGGKEATGDDGPPSSMRMGFSLSLASKKPAAAAALKRPAALGGDVAPVDAPRRELITGVAGKRRKSEGSILQHRD